MILSYLLKTILISGALTGYYLLFLKNRGFHRFNRVFLMSVPVTGFLLPLLRFNWPAFWAAGNNTAPIQILRVVQGEMEETVTVYANRSLASWFTWQNALAMVSVGVSLFLLLKLLINLNYLRRLARRAMVERFEDIEICYVEADGTPFSFFKRIFWNPALDVQSAEGQQILRHELYHVNQHHSRDILWLESIGILAWFNPFLYLIRREVIMIHEFMADAEVAAADPVNYAGMLLRYQANRFTYSGITHSFFHHPLKRRIKMLTKIPSQKNKIAGRLLLLPMLAVLAGLFAFKNNWRGDILNPLKKIRIVLDPGHGGANGGSMVNGIREQDFNLMLAKKIREVGKSYDVDIVLTREGDNTPEPAQTLRSSLEYRAKFAADQHADAFISVHMNSNDASSGAATKSGFEIYIGKKGSAQYEQSVKLGSSLNAALAKDCKTAVDLIERDKGVYVLDQAQVPAVLVECGSMDVREDMDFISTPANQEKIARDIIEGVIKFSSAGTGYVKPEKTFSGPNNDLTNSSSQTPELVGTLEKDSIPALKKVEVESEYPGGRLGWQKYLVTSLHYPDSAVNGEIQGTVLTEFIVRKDGTVDPKDIRVLSGPQVLRAESIRVIRESGKWIPAKDHGVAVNAYKIQPISYKLEEQYPKKK